MIIDATERFLLKAACDKGCETLFDIYLNLTENLPEKICERSINYLKAFAQYPPNECIRIIRSRTYLSLTISPWGEDYINLISLIGAYHLDRDERMTGLLWAMKAIHLVDYFTPTLKRNKRKDILYNMIASAMICAFPNDFDQRISDNFYLNWEFKRFHYCGNKTHFNDNLSH